MRQCSVHSCSCPWNIKSSVMKSINVQGGIFVLCRVEFSKIGKRDVTFIREMRVNSTWIQIWTLRAQINWNYYLKFLDEDKFWSKTNLTWPNPILTLRAKLDPKIGSTQGAVQKLCRLKIGDFWPSPLLSFLLSRVYLVNRLWGYLSPHPYRDEIVYERPPTYLT